MRKNIAGQNVECQLNALTDGSPVTSGETAVMVTGDGVQTLGTGTVTHLSGGLWNYKPTQIETNFDHVTFQFLNSLAPVQMVTFDTISYDPHNLNGLGLTLLTDTKATIDALENLSATDVKAQLVSALTSDVNPEATMPVTSIAEQISWLFSRFSNKVTQTANTQTIRNSNDTGDISSASITSDGTTTTVSKHT